MKKFEDLSATKKNINMKLSKHEKFIVLTIVIGSLATIGYVTRDRSDPAHNKVMVPSVDVMDRISNGTYQFYDLDAKP